MRCLEVNSRVYFEFRVVQNAVSGHFPRLIRKPLGGANSASCIALKLMHVPLAHKVAPLELVCW